MKTRFAIAGLALSLIASAALAQTVYRHVDKSGKVTFSDQPPADATQPAQSGASRAGGNASGAGNGLPYELRQVVQRYPVTLYTSDSCDPCNMARTFLTTRGVPFSERTIKSNEDIDAMKSLSGQTSLPLLTIGSQQLKGFEDGAWSQYLSAAGYPKTSQLPASFRNPPAQPLVAQVPAAAPAPAPAEPPAAAPPQPAAPAPAANPDGPSPSNPAGIKF
jgi:glutaredoxin